MESQFLTGWPQVSSFIALRLDYCSEQTGVVLQGFLLWMTGSYYYCSCLLNNPNTQGFSGNFIEPSSSEKSGREQELWNLTILSLSFDGTLGKLLNPIQVSFSSFTK